ncbi:3-methyladenine DNA glycosylase [Helicobacter sp. 16-1353]|uniref:3-methyladenine DNA glycosylase n=1 Tax=Helicobacter sp. 16-1353 TaxID=2004996 RepID=UPI000DCE552B|nr:3-methyladenine DNA glycosylase [Helicobacter sp. 16-1353]RAX53153.1 3-methyladenine DNA glycosylase [Helicobacter sp. 16-1353]
MLPNIENSFELLVFLKNQLLLKDSKDEFWWENSGSFEVVVGAILVQNTKWENVIFSLNNLKNQNLLNLESLSNCDLRLLESLIMKCGFFRQKAQRLQNLCANILESFGDFENFKENVSREWLLSQKGIGFESADSILNYALYREVMVVDRYTQRLLSECGFEFYDYDEIQNWLQNGIIENYERVENLYGKNVSLAKVYARFHAKIVEFSKQIKIKGEK